MAYPLRRILKRAIPIELIDSAIQCLMCFKQASRHFVGIIEFGQRFAGVILPSQQDFLG